jgi:hypothetical protein
LVTTKHSPEECIAENDVVHSVHTGILDDVSVNEEEYWEVDFFARSDLLLFEAEALDLGKVRRDLDSASRPDKTITSRGVTFNRTAEQERSGIPFRDTIVPRVSSIGDPGKRSRVRPTVRPGLRLHLAKGCTEAL